ncbi:MAG TPA: T9SS type A sorting domain-containing protein, partial [Bacteroidales bacterium]|nr:T9SS type A sorting domain-containing protein [Bacteroidales bacterium]
QLLLTSEELDKSEYNTWLYRCETIDADYVLAESYLNEENIAQMNTILDDIPNKYPNCDLVEVAQYKICLNYSYQWENANTDSLIITQESIDSLELIASGSNRASLKAEAMLEKLGKDIIPRWEQDRCNWWVIASTPLENKNETFIKETKIGPKQEMILTPNPATDKLKVDNGQIHIKELYIYDVVGKEVKRFKGNNTKITVSVDDLCSGVYIVKALSENGIAIKKFVKK